RQLIPFSRTRMFCHPRIQGTGIMHWGDAGHNLDCAGLWIDFDPDNGQACRRRGLDGAGDISLPEGGKPARHRKSSGMKSPHGPNAGRPKPGHWPFGSGELCRDSGSSGKSAAGAAAVGLEVLELTDAERSERLERLMDCVEGSIG